MSERPNDDWTPRDWGKPQPASEQHHDMSRPLVGLSIHGFKRIRLAELKISPSGITQVRGKNAQGKSSVLDAVVALLFGGRAAPERPINDDMASAEVVGTFGSGPDQLIVERRWSDPKDRSQTTLVVRRADGAKFPKPQEVLDRMVRESADPVALLRLKPSELAQRALGLVDIPLDLEDHARRLAGAEDKRRDLGRDMKRLQGTAKTMTEAAQGAPEAPVDTAALADELGAIERKAAERAALLREVEQRNAALEESRAAYQREAASVEAAKAALVKAEAAAVAAIERGKAAKAAAEDAAVRLDAMPQVSGDAIREQLRNAQGLNAAYEKRSAAEKCVMDSMAATRAWEQAEQSVLDLRKEREDALSEVAWPSPGMGYDAESGCLTLNLLPFSQASTAEQLIAASDLAMGKPSEIPLLLVRSGNDLDAEHLALLDQHVRECGWAMLLERVSDEPEGPGIWIEDGEAKQ